MSGAIGNIGLQPACEAVAGSIFVKVVVVLNLLKVFAHQFGAIGILAPSAMINILNNSPPDTIFNSLIKKIPVAITRQECRGGIDYCASTQRSLDSVTQVSVSILHGFLTTLLTPLG